MGGARGLGDELVGVEGLEGGTGLSFSERGRFGEVAMVRLIRPVGKRVKKLETSKKEVWMYGLSVWVASRKGDVGGGEETGASGVGNQDVSRRKQ